LLANQFIDFTADLPLIEQSRKFPFNPDSALFLDIEVLQPPVGIVPEVLSQTSCQVSMRLYFHEGTVPSYHALAIIRPNGIEGDIPIPKLLDTIDG
jgi:hypothetical protein